MTGTYSQPYFDNNEIEVEFYTLIGRMIVAWSAVERSVDVILWLSRTFDEKDGRAILAWSKKTSALKKLLNRNPKLNKDWVTDFISRLNGLGNLRNGIIHGYCSGMTNTDPPQILFRAARFHPDSSETRQLNPTTKDLSNFIGDIQKMEAEIMPITFYTISHPKRESGTTE